MPSFSIRDPISQASRSWRHILILMAVLALAHSLATRYCMTVDTDPQGMVVKSHSPGLKHQRLVIEHPGPAPLVAAFEFFQPGRPLNASFPAVSTEFRLGPQDSLYTRPPPFL